MENAQYNVLPEPIPAATLERAKKLSPAQLCDGMKGLGIERDGCMDADLMPVDGTKTMIGTACTVDTANGDNLPIHVALYQAKPGYVMVIAGKNHREKAYFGDLIGSTADALGLSGMVVDGPLRDRMGLAALNTPFYGRGYIQRGPDKKNPGGINVPVVCAGVRVNPGDLVVGDCDGVTVIPRDRISDVLEGAEKKADYEEKRRVVIAQYARCRLENKPLPNLAPDWVKEALEKLR